MSKRKLSGVVDHEEQGQPLPTRPRLDSPEPPGHELSYPPLGAALTRRPTAFQQPLPVLTFSYTPDRVLEFTDSALRYYVEPPIGADLRYGYERWVQKAEERGRLDGLLRAWSKIRKSRDGIGHVGVISWRGVLTKEGWDMNLMCVNGTMYFEEHLSDVQLKKKTNLAPHHRLQTYYGYAFESYCTSSTPTRQPGADHRNPAWGGDVNTNVQWCTVAKTKLGDTRIILGGEVDCVQGKYKGTTDTFIELKTSMAIRDHIDRAKFEQKLLKFYFQSFLMGVPRIVVGFRTPSGRISSIQSFKTLEIPRLVRDIPNSWDPLQCLAWGHDLFTFLKSIASGSDPSRVWRVHFVPRKGVTVTELDEDGVNDVEGGKDRVGFLPRWYWDETTAEPKQPATADLSESETRLLHP